MSEMRGADLVVEYLIREKVPYLFGYAGHGAVGLLDGVFDRQDEIKVVFPRIETGAAYMADAYYRVSHEVIPVYTSTGPGPMLLTAAVANAFYDSSALIAITGQVATTQYDSGALQEEYRYFQSDYPSIAKVITKRSYQAHSVGDLGKFLPKAFKLAREGRPGPVHIDVPYDLWVTKADVEVPDPAEHSLQLNWRTPGSPEAVGKALELLLGARRPLILAGGGIVCSEASAELQAFAEHVNIPVYTSFMGKGALSARHPLHLGIAGCWGEYPAQEAARNADVILALGCRFSDIHSSSWLPGYTYNIPPTKLIHVDIDPQEIGRNYPTELGIVGDVREVLKQLLSLAGQGPKRDRSPWHDQVDAYKEEWTNFIEQEKASNEVPIDPRRVVKELRAAAPDDTLMITDTGNHQTWVEQYWDVYGPQTVFTPGGFAGMGFGTYGVLGLKLARPGPARRVRHERRQLHDVPGGRRHRDRVRDPRRLGDLQQLHDRGDPRPPAVLHGRTGDRDELRQAVDRGVLEPRLRQDGAGDGGGRDLRRAARRPRVGLRDGARRGDAVRDRRQGQPRHGSAPDRDLALRPDPAGGADVREAARPVVSLYPFTAIVDQERLAQALLVNAVNPAVGGVLVEGPSGTGKSTAVRGLAELLPEIEVVADCPFSCDPADPCAACRERVERGERLGSHRRRVRVVDLPLNATEDRVAGSVDIARALREGVMALEPGLLAEANRGILYVDEINLLDDHICDVLLDAAALGVNVVEREGVSVSHPARFLLVGTMNPDEGDLRPQLADRIGLRIVVEALADPGRRAEVIRRREAFTSDPSGFAAGWAGEQAELAEAVQSARGARGHRVGRPGPLPRHRAARHRCGRREPPRRCDRPAVRQGAGGARRAHRGRARATCSRPRVSRSVTASPSTRSSPAPGWTNGSCGASSTTLSTRRRPKKKRRSR